MKRIVLAALVVGSLLAGTSSTMAAPPKEPPGLPGSCGLGRDLAHEALALEDSPGASEYATVPPSECTGQA